MPGDEIYAATRRRKGTSPLKIIKHTGGAYDPDTMVTSPATTEYAFRWFVQEPTSYSRLIRSTATQQRIGAVTFVLWGVDITRSGLSVVDTEDTVIDADGVEYRVVSSEKFKTGLMITATQIR